MEPEECECVPVLLIKNQVDRIATKIKLEPTDIKKETWNRCPCILDELNKCSKDHCYGNVNFIVLNKDGLKEVKILTLIFWRENNNAYVYFTRQLQQLFERDNDGNSILAPVISVPIYLIPPIIAEPTKRVSP
jgi:hypothetical protein